MVHFEQYHSLVLLAYAHRNVLLVNELRVRDVLWQIEPCGNSTPHPGACDGAHTSDGYRHHESVTGFTRGLPHFVMFADNAARLKRPYDTGDTSAPAILAVVKRFGSNVGVPCAF